MIQFGGTNYKIDDILTKYSDFWIFDFQKCLLGRVCFSIFRAKVRHAFSAWDLFRIADIFVATTSSTSPRAETRLAVYRALQVALRVGLEE